jgi:NAD(P)-dependent dehydrogenase (short-subunit alcohol dehydrogenase family)
MIGQNKVPSQEKSQKRKTDSPLRVVLITGASSGFGRACALYLARAGYRVYGTSRFAEFDRPPIAVDPSGSFFKMIPMDVRDAESVSNGVSHILDNEGDIDVVVNNAGFAMAGPMEEISIAEVNNQFETNFYGVIRVCQAVLPHMRRRESGYIINISSIGGVMGLPFQGAYSASKFAIEGMSEALRIEVKPFGIHVVLIEPGDFKTDSTKNRILATKAKKHSLYADRLGRTLSLMEKQEKEGRDPRLLAPLLEKIINTPNPKVRYTIGEPEQRLSALYKRWAPSLMFERSFMKYYKLL